ncbi:MAG: LacI family transcriptional regulator [Bifidobacterium sp.]|jgi:DNA-binding LacI/PurR family transcriptional regulator|nr:LacI family transcriptional regulator [Bifidobacterium sp.]
MVTMRDVAFAAGVSQATVSYALRGDASISPSTRRRVVQAAKKLNYTVNLSARNLKSGRSNAIGVVMQDLRNPYACQLADAISQYALSRGMQTVIQQTLYDRRNEASILEHVTSAFCDAVIFSPSKLNAEQIRSQLNGKPALLLSPYDDNRIYDVLYTPARQAAFVATSYILASGCKAPTFFGLGYRPLKRIDASRDSGWLRVAGFEQALARNNLVPDPARFIASEDWGYAVSERTMLKAIDAGLRFDSVVCVNDSTAIGVIRALQRRGLHVPRDVAVIGFDGIAEGEYITPSLTTIALDFHDMARKAVDTLLRRLGGEDYASHPPCQLNAQYRLICRESTH